MSFTPYPHQPEKARLFNERRRLLAKHDCGVGKTITTYIACEAEPMPTLVLAPKTVVYDAWVKDHRHFPSIDLAVYHGPKRARVLTAPHDVVVTTHETFRRDVGILERYGFKRFVIDESSKIKGFDSSVTGAAMRFARTVDRVILLSGSPAPNTPAEYWAQMHCIDPAILGPSYWGMVGRYFVPIRRTIRQGGRNVEVIQRLEQTAEQRERFTARIAPYVDILRKKDCLSLPPVTSIIRSVELGPAEWKAYRSAEKVLRVELEGGEVESLKMQSLLGKLRQIAGGSMYTASGETVPIGSSKLDALAELLEEIGPDEPVVVWAEYRHEIDRIHALIGGEVIDGRTNNGAEIVRRFQAGELKRLTCHPQACGHGITLTAACYAVFYSRSFSHELFEQAKARLDRAGQKRPVTNYILHATDTVDRAIHAVLNGKRSVAEAVYAMIRGDKTEEEREV